MSEPMRSFARDLGAPSSVLAAGACAAIAIVAATSSGFPVIHVYLFAIAATAFASNLSEGLHPSLRAIAALAQAVCVFEVFGFCVGLTVGALSGPGGWFTPWWALLVAWAILVPCVVALMSSIPRVVRARAMSKPE
jgi:hypothetical protein